MTTNPDLIQQNTELAALLRLSHAALQGKPLQSVVDCALEQVMTLIAPDHAFLYRAITNSLILMGASPRQPCPALESLEIGQCLCGLAARLATPIYAQNIHLDGRCTLNQCKKAGISSIASLPLIMDGELLGVINLASLQQRDFSSEQAVAERLASAIALAINQTMVSDSLEQKIQNLTDQLADRTAELNIRSKELERLNRLFVTREFRIKSLREQLKIFKGHQ